MNKHVLYIWPDTTILDGVDTGMVNVFTRHLDWGMDFSIAIQHELLVKGFKSIVSRETEQLGNNGLVITTRYKCSFDSPEVAVLAKLYYSDRFGTTDFDYKYLLDNDIR